VAFSVAALELGCTARGSDFDASGSVRNCAGCVGLHGWDSEVSCGLDGLCDPSDMILVDRSITFVAVAFVAVE